MFLTEQEDRENILRARESGKGVLTAPFRLIKSNRLGVILTFAVYKRDLPANATSEERTQASDGYAMFNLLNIESFEHSSIRTVEGKVIHHLSW